MTVRKTDSPQQYLSTQNLHKINPINEIKNININEKELLNRHEADSITVSNTRS